MCVDQGVCCVEQEKEQPLYFIKPDIDVFAVSNSCLPSQLRFHVLFKHILGHAIKGGEAVNRASHLRKKWLVSGNGSSAGPESSLSQLCESWRKRVGKCFAVSGWTKSTLLNALLNCGDCSRKSFKGYFLYWAVLCVCSAPSLLQRQPVSSLISPSTTGSHSQGNTDLLLPQKSDRKVSVASGFKKINCLSLI